MIAYQSLSIATNILALGLALASHARAGDVVSGDQISFRNGTTTLAGTLSVPPGAGPHPAVVLISGSGPQDRDGAVDAIPGYRPFKLIAEHLNQQGIAVLRYDDRGVGKSSGDYLKADERGFVKDAEAAFEYLSHRDEIDSSKIGLLGHSEGALIAAMVTGQNKRVAFVVSLGGPGGKGYDLILQQARRAAEAEGMSDEEVAQVVREQRRLFDLVLAQKWDELERAAHEITIRRLRALPDEKKLLIGDLETFAERKTTSSMRAFRTKRYRFLLDHDSTEDWVKVKAPVLAIFGELDVQCDATQNRAGIEQALKRGGNRNLTIHVIPGANHLFLKARSGSMSEYLTLPKDAFAPDVLTTISRWIRDTVKVK